MLTNQRFEKQEQEQEQIAVKQHCTNNRSHIRLHWGIGIKQSTSRNLTIVFSKTSDFSDFTTSQWVNERLNLHLWKEQKSWPRCLVMPGRGGRAEEAQNLQWSGQDGERRQRWGSNEEGIDSLWSPFNQKLYGRLVCVRVCAKRRDSCHAFVFVCAHKRSCLVG